MRRGLPAFLLLTLSACISLFPDYEADLDTAVQDLARGGFAFDTDVAFRSDRIAVCDGFSCADVRVEGGRRTVVVSRDGFISPALLRAALLDVWTRYEQPRAPNFEDEARSALLILRHGRAVGIDDTAFLRRTHHRYRQLRSQVPRAERASLPAANDVPYP